MTATWLYRIAVNRSLDFLRARKMTDNRQIADNPAPDEDGAESQIQVALRRPGPTACY